MTTSNNLDILLAYILSVLILTSENMFTVEFLGNLELLQNFMFT